MSQDSQNDVEWFPFGRTIVSLQLAPTVNIYAPSKRRTNRWWYFSFDESVHFYHYEKEIHGGHYDRPGLNFV